MASAVMCTWAKGISLKLATFPRKAERGTANHSPLLGETTLLAIINFNLHVQNFDDTYKYKAE